MDYYEVTPEDFETFMYYYGKDGLWADAGIGNTTFGMFHSAHKKMVKMYPELNFRFGIAELEHVAKILMIRKEMLKYNL